MGEGLTTRTLGLVGGGGIGQELIPLARPFFAEALVADRHVQGQVFEAIGARKVALETVLEETDYLVVACPLTPETHHLMDSAACMRLKRGATYLAAAGLNVHEIGPLPATSALIGMDNGILAPHALCWTDECFEDIARTALRSIADVSLGRRPRHVVAPG